MVKVRTTMEPEVEVEVSERERDGMAAQGYLLEESKSKSGPESKDEDKKK